MLKMPLKGFTVTASFNGVTEMDGQFVNFLSTSVELFSGGISPPLLRLLRECH